LTADARWAEYQEKSVLRFQARLVKEIEEASSGGSVSPNTRPELTVAAEREQTDLVVSSIGVARAR
jgi:hypothetical protein